MRERVVTSGPFLIPSLTLLSPPPPPPPPPPRHPSPRSRKKKKRIVLMNSNGVRNKSTGEVYPLAERILTGLLYFTLPPHADNVEAAEYLINEVGEHPNVEWCCVRPGDLLDGHENEDYEVVGSVDPSKGVVLGPWKTSRFQVAHFMASLGEGGKVWEDWKFRTPVIYSPALGA